MIARLEPWLILGAWAPLGKQVYRSNNPKRHTIRACEAYLSTARRSLVPNSHWLAAARIAYRHGDRQVGRTEEGPGGSVQVAF
jgi:hypothetical protein